MLKWWCLGGLHRLLIAGLFLPEQRDLPPFMKEPVPALATAADFVGLLKQQLVSHLGEHEQMSQREAVGRCRTLSLSKTMLNRRRPEKALDVKPADKTSGWILV